MFHFHQVVDRSLVFDDKREFVNPFVHSVVTDDLPAVQSSCLFVESDFDTHRHGIRIVAGMRGGMDGR